MQRVYFKSLFMLNGDTLYRWKRMLSLALLLKHPQYLLAMYTGGICLLENWSKQNGGECYHRTYKKLNFPKKSQTKE